MRRSVVASSAELANVHHRDLVTTTCPSESGNVGFENGSAVVSMPAPCRLGWLHASLGDYPFATAGALRRMRWRCSTRNTVAR